MGCFGSKTTVEEYYATDEGADEASSSHGGSTRSSTESGGGKVSLRESGKSQNKKGGKSEKHSTRASIAKAPDIDQPGVPESDAKGDRSKTRRESANPNPDRRRSSDCDSQHTLQASCEAAAPFSTFEISWKIRGVRCTEVDWIGMYKGNYDEAPADINDAVSTAMGTGKAQGTVKFTAPNDPGMHHFRYFDANDGLVVVGAEVDVTKLDASEVKADIFIRDAVVAEAEVSRIAGDDVGDVIEDEEDLTADPVERKLKEKARTYEDMTGFESSKDDGPGVAGNKSDQLEKWKKEADNKSNEKAEATMEAATSYFKKMPTKKELRELEKKKLNNVPQSTHQKEAVPGPEAEAEGAEKPKKTGGWFKAKAVVKSGGFSQGRAGGGDGNSLKNRKQNVAAAAGKPKAEDIGSISLARGKK